MSRYQPKSILLSSLQLYVMIKVWYKFSSFTFIQYPILLSVVISSTSSLLHPKSEIAWDQEDNETEERQCIQEYTSGRESEKREAKKWKTRNERLDVFSSRLSSLQEQQEESREEDRLASPLNGFISWIMEETEETRGRVKGNRTWMRWSNRGH